MLRSVRMSQEGMLIGENYIMVSVTDTKAQTRIYSRIALHCIALHYIAPPDIALRMHDIDTYTNAPIHYIH